MDRQPSGRPISTRPPSAVPVPRSAMTSGTSRPFTQQGLSGLRPPPTSGAGTNRIYRDKRFYMSRMQAHMNAIREEIVRLNRSTLDFRVQSMNRQEMRKTAEATAKKLTEKQELLTVYNTALDMHLSKTRTEEIAAETADLKQRNEMLLKELDNIYQKKIRKEEEIEDLKKKISQEDEFIKSMINKLSPESKERYYAMAQQNRDTLESIAHMQQKIKDSKEMIESHKTNIMQSMAKQKKLQLLRNMALFKMQKKELDTFVQNTLTPAQQREKLLEQVKQDKTDIESLLKVKASVEEELGNNETRLGELEHELDGKDNARLKKHKELRERGEHMEKFIAEYDGKAQEIKAKLRNLNDDIATSLEHMSENLAEVNLRELDVKFDHNEQNTIEGLINKYKLLTTQITRITTVRLKYQKEIDDMREKMQKMQTEMDLYKDIDKGRVTLEEKRDELQDQQNQMQSKLDSTRSAVLEVRKRLETMKKRIEENDDFNEIMNLEKNIEEVEVESKELESTLKTESNSEEMDGMLSQLDDLLTKRNAKLIESLKKNGSRKTFE